MFRIIVKTSGFRPTRPERPPIVALRVKSLGVPVRPPIAACEPDVATGTEEFSA